MAQYVVIHQARGSGTRRWNVGRGLRRGGTDKSFGDNMTKGEARHLATTVNDVIARFRSRQGATGRTDARAEIHQTRGTGTHRWEVGWRLASRSRTDKSFGDNLTNGQATKRRSDVNRIIEKYVEQQTLEAVHRGLERWAEDAGSALSNYAVGELPGLRGILKQVRQYLNGLAQIE